MLETILVPLDGSNWGEWVLPYAEEIAGVFNLQIHLVYVSDKKNL
jgi:nucleotide-binding universal stress UspA family protein